MQVLKPVLEKEVGRTLDSGAGAHGREWQMRVNIDCKFTVGGPITDAITWFPGPVGHNLISRDLPHNIDGLIKSKCKLPGSLSPEQALRHHESPQTCVGNK